MSPAEMDAIADAVVKRLGPRLTVPIRLPRKLMAASIGVSARTLQGWSNREADPCPTTRIESIILYDPPLVHDWLSRQTKSPAGRPGGGKD